MRCLSWRSARGFVGRLDPSFVQLKASATGGSCARCGSGVPPSHPGVLRQCLIAGSPVQSLCLESRGRNRCNVLGGGLIGWKDAYKSRSNNARRVVHFLAGTQDLPNIVFASGKGSSVVEKSPTRGSWRRRRCCLSVSGAVQRTFV